MKILGVILGYFYILVLSLWSIALPQYDYLIFEDQSNKLEISSGEAGTLDQSDKFYLISHPNNFYAGTMPGYGQPEINQFFGVYPFPDLYWKNFRATVHAFLMSATVQFKATDIIFPFHYFL